VERFGLAPGYTFDALASAMLQGPKTLFLVMEGA